MIVAVMIVAVAAITLSVFAEQSAPLDHSIPDKIHQVGGTLEKPVWMSEEVFSRSTIAEMSEHDQDLLLDVLQHFPLTAESGLEGCQPHSSLSFHYPATTAEELSERAHYIAFVSVRGAKAGIHRAKPGELLDIEVDRVFKDEGRVSFESGFYLFHDYARMVIEGHAVCTGERLPSGQYLVFIEHDAPQTELPIYDLEASALISLSDHPSIHGRLFSPGNPEKALPVLLGRFER